MIWISWCLEFYAVSVYKANSCVGEYAHYKSLWFVIASTEAQSLNNGRSSECHSLHLTLLSPTEVTPFQCLLLEWQMRLSWLITNCPLEEVLQLNR